VDYLRTLFQSRMDELVQKLSRKVTVESLLETRRGGLEVMEFTGDLVSPASLVICIRRQADMSGFQGASRLEVE
jgi:hypothetical protein